MNPELTLWLFAAVTAEVPINEDDRNDTKPALRDMKQAFTRREQDPIV
jgi:hypothetical protein